MVNCVAWSSSQVGYARNPLPPPADMSQSPVPARTNTLAEPAPPRRRLTSLRARLAAIILLALLPAFLLLIAVATFERSRAAESAAAEQLALARLTRTRNLELISSTEQLMSWAALFPEVRVGDSAACTRRLNQLLELLSDYRGMSVAERDGSTNCIAAPEPVTTTLQMADQLYFRRVMESGRFAVGGLDIGTVSRRPNITFGMPIFGDDGQITRVLGAGIDVDGLNRRLIGANFPRDAVLNLADANGQIILHSSKPQEFIGRTFPMEQLLGDSSAKEGVEYATDLDGVRRQWAWSAVDYDGETVFYALVGYSDEHIFGGGRRTLLAGLLGLTIATLITLVVLRLSAESMIVRPIDKLVKVAKRMSEGDLRVRTGMADDPGEFGQLAATLDTMADALEVRIGENVRLLEEMTQLNEELEQRVAVRTRQLERSNTRLLESESELRRLSQELMQATELERERISREIHDQLGQMITAIKMEVSTLRRRIVAGSTGVTSKIDDIGALLDETVTLVRRISADLRPGVLDDFGLAAAAEGYLAEFEKRTGVGYALNLALDEKLILPNMATAVFRILQESLTNVTRHAEADHVTVDLRTQDHLLTLRVQDNGRGITPEEQSTRRSLGLLGMRERAGQLGGSLELIGLPDKGTTVVLQLPLDEQSATISSSSNGETDDTVKGSTA